ncbi:MAG: hypothetical protein RJA36_3373 [Pseudomonadota bacterium]|jgi:two-component system sensor histidine kinase DctS
MTPEPAPDLDQFGLDASRAAALDRRAMRWLLALLALVMACVVLLALFLRQIEADEEDLRRAADAEWLDQTLRFHFRRLESDLGRLAAAARPDAAAAAPLMRAGALWRGAGVIAHHGWIAAQRQGVIEHWPAFLRDAARQGDHAGALAVMLSTGRGLQRAAYAGPLAPPPDSPDAPGLTLWLAVPRFEQGRFLGSYVAAVRVERALEQVVPGWFLQDHALAVADQGSGATADSAPSGFQAAINLPGTQWTLRVGVLQARPAPAPRTLFGVALLCLGGMLAALLLLWRDAARRRRTESRLQAQMALRAAMERSLTLGLRAWDMQGRLIYANQAFCRLVGWSPAELVAAAAAPPYWPEGQGDEFARITQADDVGAEPQLGIELQLRHRDGHLLDVLAHGSPLVLADGSVMGWLASVLDITERRRIERLAARQQEKLEASGRLIAVGEVASTLAHELNQPLGALSSFANGLLNRLRERRITLDEIEPVVERMERMAQKAGRVIQRVNAFARRQEMTRQPLELVDFVRRVAGQVPLPDGLTLELRLPDAPLQAPADALLLEHALHNVVLNATEWASQAITGGGHRHAVVRVSLEQAGDMAAIRIEDSGPGVPPGQAVSIFDAFSSQKAGGMGMGLSICRSIVEAHHGRIEVTRSAALQGAQFTLWLPLKP